MHIRLSNSVSGLELNQQLFFYLKIMLKLAVTMDFGDCFDDESHMVHAHVMRNELKIKQLHLSLNQMNLMVYNFLESLGGFEAYQIFEEMYNDRKNNRVLWNTVFGHFDHFGFDERLRHRCWF